MLFVWITGKLSASGSPRLGDFGGRESLGSKGIEKTGREKPFWRGELVSGTYRFAARRRHSTLRGFLVSSRKKAGSCRDFAYSAPELSRLSGDDAGIRSSLTGLGRRAVISCMEPGDEIRYRA